MAFKIETDVPLPLRNERVSAPDGTGRPMEYPWASMPPGSSVLLPGKVSPPTSSLQNWRKKHPDQAFTTRKEPGGIRVWRIR